MRRVTQFHRGILVLHKAVPECLTLHACAKYGLRFAHARKELILAFGEEAVLDECIPGGDRKELFCIGEEGIPSRPQLGGGGFNALVQVSACLLCLLHGGGSLVHLGFARDLFRPLAGMREAGSSVDCAAHRAHALALLLNLVSELPCDEVGLSKKEAAVEVRVILRGLLGLFGEGQEGGAVSVQERKGFLQICGARCDAVLAREAV